MGKPQPAIAERPELGIAVIALERVAAGRNECHGLVEQRPLELPIGEAASHLGIERVGMERPGAGHAENVLAQHVELETCRRLGVLRALDDRRPRCLAFQDLEPVRRNE
jgi:hypothetical protein